MTRSYASPAAFRQALDARLRTLAAERGVQIQGLRLKVAIERLLDRLFRPATPAWRLKGGYAMELRFRPRARTTRDVDLTVSKSAAEGTVAERLKAVHRELQTAASTDLGDFFQFTIPPARRELTAAPGGGGVFDVMASVAGRESARFHIDVGFGDVQLGPPDTLRGDDILAFAEIPPPTVLAIRVAQQFAEKIHAYTFPWTDRENSRSRDLVDMVLLIERGGLETEAVRDAVIATFERRDSHAVPAELPPPPRFWADDFPGMAIEADISTTDVDEAFAVLRSFWARLQPLREREP